MKTLFALAKEGRWKELVDLISNADSQELKDTALSIGLSLNAEPHIVNAIIQSGATVHQGLLSAAILSNNTSIFKILMDNGLDVSEPIEKNLYPVVLAAKFAKAASLSFILAQGAEPNPSITGYDALDYVLMSQEPIQRRVEMIKLLLDYGMPVKISHKQIVDHLGFKRIDEYAILINNFPELSKKNS